MTYLIGYDHLWLAHDDERQVELHVCEGEAFVHTSACDLVLVQELKHMT